VFQVNALAEPRSAIAAPEAMTSAKAPKTKDFFIVYLLRGR
jgi:hypothetical protein